MRLTMQERRSVTAVVAKRYVKAGKKEKMRILDEFTQLTGYNRSYAGFLLRGHGKKLRVSGKTVLIGDSSQKIKIVTARTYDENVVGASENVMRYSLVRSSFLQSPNPGDLKYFF